MQNIVKVSIIIPVYKVEKYIDACLSSILSQTLKDIEIILVDDGSPDNCGKICEDYAKKDSRIKVIHQTNGRQGKARNNGALIAKGEYIGFVDSDDWISPYMYEELYNKAKKTDADIVMCDYSRCRFVGDTKCSTKSRIDKLFKENDTFNVLKLKKSPHRKSFFCVVVCWNKIFKRNFYLKNIKFPENIIFEDTPVMFNAFAKAKTISTVDKKLYFYRITNANSSSISNDIKVFDLFKSGNIILDNLEHFNYKKFQKFIIASLVRDYIHHLNKLKGDLKKQYIHKLKDIIHRIKQLNSYKYISFKDKLRLKFYFLLERCK